MIVNSAAQSSLVTVPETSGRAAKLHRAAEEILDGCSEISAAGTGLPQGLTATDAQQHLHQGQCGQI